VSASELPTVLIVEDEAHMRRFLRTTLTHNGFATVEASDGVEAVDAMRQREPNLILLDLGLPDVDGIDIVAKVRLTSEVPIIVLSARDFEYSKIEALDAGVNDYVTKPFGAGELLARIRAALRARSQAKEPPTAAVLSLGELQIDFTEHRVTLRGEEVHLTPTEYKLLAVMARRLGRAVAHKELLREVWGADSTEQVEYLRVFMRQLRYKLESEPSQPRFLLTVPGVGYRLAER
jgi:two-component system KDP operon response regulator KdpE